MQPERMTWEERRSDSPVDSVGDDPVTAAVALTALLYRYTADPEPVVGYASAPGSPPVSVTVPVTDGTTAAEVADRISAALDAGRPDGDPARALVLAPGVRDAPVDADLVLRLDGSGGGVLSVGAGLADAVEVGASAGHLRRLVEAVTAEPHAPVGGLPLSDAAESERQLHLWNDTAAEVPAPFFHERIAAIARRTPDALAVADGQLRLTFGELDERADRLAGHLRGLGAGRGTRVAVCLPRSAYHVLVQVAVLKLGAAVVLLDPAQPDDRLIGLAADSGAGLVVTAEPIARRLDGGWSSPVVRVDTDDWAAADPAPPAAVTAETVCHVVYTSGSTGRPKAVAQRHGALRALVATLAAQTCMDADSRGTWMAPPGVGMIVVDCFPLLAVGAAVLIPEPDVAGHPERLRDWLVAERITHTLVLTAVAERLWALDWPAGSALRSLRVAGERLGSWPAPDLPFQVLNVYGSSEATVVATGDLTRLSRALGPAGRAARRPPIGRPAPNVRAYVLDSGLCPVPPGVRGELYVSGVGLAAGYLDRPAVDGEKFLPNTLPGDPHPVLYRTGDTARRWPDGTLEIVGRADHEVKIRGFRVHLGEVEAALGDLPGVRQAVVTVREDVPGERRLVAYLEPDAGRPPRPRDLRTVLAQRLPAYMVPAAWVVLDELPLSRNGKVDRAALPAPGPGRPDVATDFAEPHDDLERSLLTGWEEVVGIQGAGVLDDFFDLGGDSLSAIRLVNRISHEHRIDFTLSDLAAAPSVRAAARRVAELRADGAGGGPERLPVLRPTGDPHAPFPLTEVQQAFWIGRGAAVDFGNVGCHGYFEWEREGLDPDRFRRAWRTLMDRHPMLSAVILPDGTQQVLADTGDDGVRVLDLRQEPADRAEQRVLRVREEMSHQVMDAHRWPLYDVRLSLLPDGRVRLHMGIDLLIMDAWSWFQVLLPDLIDLYEHPGIELEPLAVTFRDYVVEALPALQRSPAYHRSREYWLSRLPDLPPAPDLPMLTEPRGEVRFERFAHRVAQDRWQRLKDHARRAGITSSGVLIAAFAEVVRTWSGNDTFTINFPLFDRLDVHPQIDRLLGDFSNTLLVAVEKSDGTFLDRARDIQRRLWADLEHRHFNGVEVLRQLGRMQGASLRPAMPIVVTSLLGHPPRQQMSALGRETYGVSQTPQVLLDVQIREIDGCLHFKWDHLAAYFPPGMIEAMFGAYVRLIDRLIDDERSWLVERFPLVPEEQLRRRAEVNDTAGDVPAILLHELMARQAAERPDAPAVLTGGRTMTFGELFSVANRIGRRLREHGVRPGDLVPVVMTKGWEQYAAVYGILTAGGAYLPVDPGIPPERLRYIVTSCGARFALTQPSLSTRIGWPEGLRILAVDDSLAEFSVDDSPLPSAQRPTDLAYVIYTSGSTGTPKGVMIDHRAIVNMVTDINSRFGVSPDDRAFAISGLHFDISVYDVFGVLAAGGAAVLPDPSEHPDPRHWAELVQRTGATLWNSVPALMEMLVDRVEQTGSRGLDALSSLRVVMMGGDFIPLTLPDRLRALARDVRVLSCGGPTETACFSILYPIAEIDPQWVSIPYGFPMTNQRYHVVDHRLEHRPDWVPGQMVVGSEVGLAQGYVGDEETTRARFFTLPGTGERVYATGDLGRYRPDGSLEILGRDDFQVKVNGYRIELGEVESALQRHPAVRTAVVCAPRTGAGARHLVAFVVPADGRTVDVTEVRAFVRSWLPPYMVPGDVRVLDELPLTRNGKTDRLSLAASAAQGRPEPAVARAAPEGPLERYVARLYAEVLGIDKVGTGEDFFQLGGDSLTGTRLTGRLTEALGVEVSLREVFGHPTPASLAAVVAADADRGAEAVLLAEAVLELWEAADRTDGG